ncbi:MAG: hypothetical protein RQ760_21505 [Sedimentisphaerales bacterium]|nr:hypothetical protein [Sedimentisphaerales bacterium]
MNIKSNLIVTAFFVCALFAFGIQTCRGMDRPWREEQQQILKDSEQFQIEPQGTLEIQNKVLEETLEKVNEQSSRLNPSLISIRNHVNRLLAKEQVKPREIEALKINLNEMAGSLRSESERIEYEKLSEKLDIIYRYTQSMDKLKESYASIVERMNKNFEQVDRREVKVSLWKNIMSGGFIVSFITNMFALLGFMIKMPNAKLERQLKQLQIAEKKAQLKQNGIEPENYL